MKIRTKLLAAFLLVALLVPLLGGLAVRRAHQVDRDVERLNRVALPALDVTKRLETAQRDQQAAVLAYLATGSNEDRQRYADRAREFDQDLHTLTAWAANPAEATPPHLADVVQHISDERTKFTAAAGQLISSRSTIDRSLADLRDKGDDIVRELDAVVRRPGAAGAVPAVSGTVAARRESGDVQLGAQGMLRVIELEYRLAAAYTIKQEEPARKQFESAGVTFNSWLQLANAAASPEERAVLARVQSKFLKEFEPSARSMLIAADFAAKARSVFQDASADISRLLNGFVSQSATNAQTAQGNAERTAQGTGTLMLAFTLIGFAIAGALGLLFARGITRPIAQLRDAADRVSHGDLQAADIRVESNDEVGDLARAFRRMMASLRILMPSEVSDEERTLTRV